MSRLFRLAIHVESSRGLGAWNPSCTWPSKLPRSMQFHLNASSTHNRRQRESANDRLLRTPSLMSPVFCLFLYGPTRGLLSVFLMDHLFGFHFCGMDSACRGQTRTCDIHPSIAGYAPRTSRVGNRGTLHNLHTLHTTFVAVPVGVSRHASFVLSTTSDMLISL